MRISDWSSDVCSSDLPGPREPARHRLGLAPAPDQDSRMTTPAVATGHPAKLPRQIPYIIGNEGCERFSFYGMRNILVPFLVSSILLAYLPESMREGAAKDIFHIFVIGDRKSVGSGTSVSVRVYLGGRRNDKKNKK